MSIHWEYSRVFYYVARTGSISGAAQLLFLSQPAVSRTVGKLEQELGCTLFLRQSRGIRLTAEGEVLYRHVSEAMTQLDAAEVRIRRMAEYEAGALSIGSTESALSFYLLPILAAFRQKYPRVHVHVTGSATRELIAMTRAGTVDLAVVMTPLPGHEGLDVTELADFQDIFVAAEPFAHLATGPVTASQLAQCPLIGLEKGTSARRHLDDWFAGQGLAFEPEYSVRTTTLVKPFVARGLGIGILPREFAFDLLEQPGVFAVATQIPIPPRKLCLIVNRDAPQSALCRAFTAFLRG